MITGSSGRLGKALAAAARSAGHSVLCLDRVRAEGLEQECQSEFIELDLSDYERTAAALKGADAIAHLATHGPPWRDADHRLHNNNVTISYNVLRAAAEHGVGRICMASSVNAIGMLYSQRRRFDYFPVDEKHPSYNDDPYSLSKWISECQADSVARRYSGVRIASLRFHWVVESRAVAGAAYRSDVAKGAAQLWGYTPMKLAVDACLAALAAEFSGHEVFNIVAHDTAVDVPSLDLARQFYPDVRAVEGLSGLTSFFSSAKARQVLFGRGRQVTAAG